MVDTFYGPWTINVVGPGGFILAVEGTEGGDGSYDLDGPSPLSFRGDEWTVTVLVWFPFPFPGAWRPTVARRAMRFEPGSGLVVDLLANSTSDIAGTPPLRLRCVSDDPDIVPIPAGPPTDFTLPGS